MNQDTNTNHDFYRDRLSAYHDEELSDSDRRVLAEHLKGCAECSQMLTNLKRLDTIVDERGHLDGEEYFEESARQIEHKLGFVAAPKVIDVRPARFTGRGWRIAAIAASVAALTFVGLQHEEIMEAFTGGGERSWETPTGSDQASRERYQPDVLPPEVDQALLEEESEEALAGRTAIPAEALGRIEEDAAEEPVTVPGETIVAHSSTIDKFETMSDTITEPAPAYASAPKSEQSVAEPEAAGGKMKQSAVDESGAGQPSRGKSREDSKSSAVAEMAMSKLVSESSEKQQIDLDTMQEHVPGSTVDELLRQVEGVVTSSDGDIYIRGGRAGDVNLVGRGPYGFWRDRRDSLESLDNSDVSSVSERGLIEAYYQIAKDTEDDSERVACLDSLRSLRKRASTTNRELAEKYLEELKD